MKTWQWIVIVLGIMLSIYIVAREHNVKFSLFNKTVITNEPTVKYIVETYLPPKHYDGLPMSATASIVYLNGWDRQ